MIAGYFIHETLKDSWRLKIKKVLSVLVPVAAVVLLVFPLTTKIRRDPEIFSLKESLTQKKLNPTRWTIVANGYPFYALASLNEWVDGSLTYQDATPKKYECSNCVFLVKNEVKRDFLTLNPDFTEFAYLKNYGTTFIVPKSYLKVPLQL
jgi:hypothetical protein